MPSLGRPAESCLWVVCPVLERYLPSLIRVIASITYGVGSSHGNGYRDDLYNLIANDGNTVNMVGTQKGGDFVDPDNEGWPGYVISQVNDKGQISMPINRPNIVTILVGTNDMSQNIAAGAPDRLGALIDNILNWEWLTLVVVSTLPPNGNADTNARIDTYNAALPAVVKARTDAGRSVILVDSHAVVAVSDLVDGTHPNDAAYERMGKAFYDGIVLAESKGWLFDVYGAPP
jgi:lysophospholipase L1-like esterase